MAIQCALAIGAGVPQFLFFLRTQSLCHCVVFEMLIEVLIE